MDEKVAILKYLLMAFMARATLLATDEQIQELRKAIRVSNFGDEPDRKCAEAILQAIEEYRKD